MFLVKAQVSPQGGREKSRTGPELSEVMLGCRWGWRREGRLRRVNGERKRRERGDGELPCNLGQYTGLF